MKNLLWKILKQVGYKSARRKRHINEKTRIRDEEGSTFFLCIFTYFYFVENGSKKLDFRKLKGTQGNSRELKGTQGNSREALVEVMEGKKLRKRGKEVKFHKWHKKKKKRENIKALYERLKIFCQNNYLVVLSINVVFTKFFAEQVWSKFPWFPHCEMATKNFVNSQIVRTL